MAQKCVCLTFFFFFFLFSAQIICGGFQTAAYGSEEGGVQMWGGGENGELGTGRQVCVLYLILFCSNIFYNIL